MRKDMAIVLAAALLFLILAHLATAYDRTVLVESFTNWG